MTQLLILAWSGQPMTRLALTNERALQHLLPSLSAPTVPANEEPSLRARDYSIASQPLAAYATQAERYPDTANALIAVLDEALHTRSRLRLTQARHYPHAELAPSPILDLDFVPPEPNTLLTIIARHGRTAAITAASAIDHARTLGRDNLAFYLDWITKPYRDIGATLPHRRELMIAANILQIRTPAMRQREHA